MISGHWITVLMTVLLIVSCTTNQQNKVDLKTLKSEVLAVHDEVMPKMGELRKVEKMLRGQLEQSREDTSLNTSIAKAADAIEAANESMMNWMRNYDPDFDGKDAEVEAYLRGQMQSIQRVREDMSASLEAGRKLLSE